MTEITRYAIFLPPEALSEGTRAARPNGMWYCQGLPNDPTDFGFAIMYRSEDQARKAINTGRGAKYSATAKIIPVKCTFDLD